MRGDKSLLVFFALAGLIGLLLNDAAWQIKTIAFLTLVVVAFFYYWRRDAKELDRLTDELIRTRTEKGIK
jgi:membrane protein implicated in regulation of membrane protease activity